MKVDSKYETVTVSRWRVMMTVVPTSFRETWLMASMTATQPEPSQPAPNNPNPKFDFIINTRA
jgi:hypothetical protein